MSATNLEYQKLALDSSNDMMDHDAERGLGRYPKAAWHVLQAGEARVQMGQMMFDAGEFAQAAADWISAAECFYLGTDQNRMREPLERVRVLFEEGMIPPERGDILTAFTERIEQREALRSKLMQLVGVVREQCRTPLTGQQGKLKQLVLQLRELPGLALLHLAIHHRAWALGQIPLAAEHLQWAVAFASGAPQFTMSQIDQLLAEGKPDRAIELGWTALREGSSAPDIRIALARALGANVGEHTPDRESAIRVLQPLIDDAEANTPWRLLALAQAATLHLELSNLVEYRHLLDTFDCLAPTLQEQDERMRAAELRRAIPIPDGNGATINPGAFPSFPHFVYAQLLRTEQLCFGAIVSAA